MTDDMAMARALELALRGTGKVSPNPRVGAVIVENDSIVGEGWHREFGAPHAEIEAINNAGITNFENATLYVNLEPCSHTGKTPPCADFIAEKGFKRVVIGMIDPNPLVSGRGIEVLKAAGISIETGILEDDCRWINRTFIKHIVTGMPYVVLKAAQTLDGSIATSRGESKWISGEESRKTSQVLRATLDAVLVGRSTAEFDNPGLTVRNIVGRNPRRVILDTRLSLPMNLNVFSDDIRDQTIVFCGEHASKSKKADALRTSGVTVISARLTREAQLDLPDILRSLSSEFSIASILVEGGANVYSSFASNNLIDELHMFIAPKLFGKGIGTFGSYTAQFLRQAPEFRIVSVSPCGNDIHLVAVK